MFAPHNLIHDAPFTRIDLASCRNLLIYLKPSAQQKALSLFHFSLRLEGLLFLGPSENPPNELLGDFDILDSSWRLYRKRRNADEVIWSEELYALFGVDRDKFRPSYRSFLECVAEADRDSVRDTINKALREGEN